MFAGTLTPEGFVSFYEEILPIRETKNTIIIKGPSGSGKSTYLKKLAADFENEGFMVEHLHCSNDANSLDGVCIPQLRICVFDGTAPHEVDPTVPIVEQIFNTGKFVDVDKVLLNRDELISLVAEKRALSQRAGNYLKAAYNVYRNNTQIYEGLMNKAALSKLSMKLVAGLPANSFDGIGNNRRFFATALTPDGLINFTNSFLSKSFSSRVYMLKARDGMGADLILSDIQTSANKRGFDTESFFCPIKPSKIEHLTIPELRLCYTTSNRYHTLRGPVYSEINLKKFCAPMNTYKGEIKFNDRLFKKLAGKTMSTMQASRSVHERIEQIYIHAMNFKKLDKAYQQLTLSLKKAVRGN